jgi:hypothetical protein
MGEGTASAEPDPTLIFDNLVGVCSRIKIDWIQRLHSQAIAGVDEVFTENLILVTLKIRP